MNVLQPQGPLRPDRRGHAGQHRRAARHGSATSPPTSRKSSPSRRAAAASTSTPGWRTHSGSCATRHAKIKHVILFSDAADAEEKTAGEMPDGAPAGRGTSHRPRQRHAGGEDHRQRGRPRHRTRQGRGLPARLLAERGNGRFYLTNDATTLPQIFSTETMKVAQSSLVEEPFNPVPAAPSPLTAGIDWKTLPRRCSATMPPSPSPPRRSRSPPNSASRCWPPGATVSGRPRRSPATPPRAGPANGWTWDGYGKFWAQVVRGLLRKSEQAAFQVRATEHGRRQPAAAGHRRAHAGRRFPRPAAHRRDGAGHRHRPRRRAVRAEQIAPGSYRAEFDLPAPDADAAGGGGGDDDVLGQSRPN